MIVGRTYSAVCPVAAVVAFIASRQDRPGSFFMDAKHAPVTKPWLVKQVRDILSPVGLPQNEYASFRIGAATIKALGQRQSAAFLQYIRMPREQLDAISRRLVSDIPDAPSLCRAPDAVATP